MDQPEPLVAGIIILGVAILIAALTLGPHFARARLTRGGAALCGPGRYRLEKVSVDGRAAGEVLVGEHRIGEIRVRDFVSQSSHPGAPRLTSIYVSAGAPTLAILPRAWETNLLLSRLSWFRPHPTGDPALDQALAVHVDDPDVAHALLGRAEFRETLAHLASLPGFLRLEACPASKARLLSFSPAHHGLEGGIGIEIHGGLDHQLFGQAGHAVEVLDRFRRAVSA